MPQKSIWAPMMRQKLPESTYSCVAENKKIRQLVTHCYTKGTIYTLILRY